MTVSRKSDTQKIQLFDNRIEESRTPISRIDEFTFESGASICQRFDISESTLLRIASKNRIKRHKIPGSAAIRYRTMDLVRLIDSEWLSKGDENYERT